MMPAKRKKAGRKRWEPTKRDRENIKKMIGLGLTVQQVADLVGKSRDVIYRKCKAEINAGRPKAINDVAKTAYKMALSGKSPVMTIFWLKTVAGWAKGVPEPWEVVSDTHDPLIDAIEGLATKAFANVIQDGWTPGYVDQPLDADTDDEDLELDPDPDTAADLETDADTYLDDE